MKNNKQNFMSNKQRGATLFTALVFITLMTLVGVSAAKISMLDVLIAGNNQQQVMLYQQTENELTTLTTPVKLLRTLALKGISDEWVYQVTATKKITNKVTKYDCEAGGAATSIGSGNTSKCLLFDFEARERVPNSSANDKHNRGAGKEIPDISRYNAIED